MIQAQQSIVRAQAIPREQKQVPVREVREQMQVQSTVREVRREPMSVSKWRVRERLRAP